MKKILIGIGLFVGSLLTGALIAYAAPSVSAIFQGGTGTTTAPTSQLIYGGTGPVYQSVATTSVICSGSTTCTGFTAIGSSPITISSSGGGSSGSWFVADTNYNQSVNSTSTLPIWFKLGLMSSSTAYLTAFNSTYGTTTYASSTALTATNLVATNATTTALGWISILDNVLYTNHAGNTVGVATSTVTFNSPFTTAGTAGYQVGGSGYSISCQSATGAQNGCLTSTDWTTFNNKQAPGFQISTTSALTISNIAYYTNVTGTTIGGVATSTTGTASTVAFLDSKQHITIPYASSTSQTVTGATYAATTAGGLNVGTTTNLITGGVTASSTILSFEYNPATSTSQTIDWSAGNSQLLRTGTGATTITFSNNKPGEKLTVSVCNPGSSAGALTWPATVRWVGGTAPSQTTGANHCDVWSFIDTMGTTTEVQFGAASLNF